MNPRWIEAWLYFVALLVAGMVTLGGVTRLTGSGLSIVSWDLIAGVVPPLGEAAWAEAFEAYRRTPQYRQVNAWMELDDFRRIFWWEWLHRMGGRLVGVAYVAPLVLFALRRSLPPGLAGRLLLLLALGALQGGVGWWMVRSGLVDRVSVEPLRLVAHLVLAFVILGLLLDAALRLRRLPAAVAAPRRGCLLLVALLLLQVAGGALVAGSGAGRVHTDWPLFNGDLLPPLSLSPVAWLSDHALVQFQHRMLAYLVLAAATWLAALGLRGGRSAARIPLLALAVAVWCQAALGVATLMAVAPADLALAHQAGAVAVFSLAVVAHRLLAGSPARRGSAADSAGI